MFAFSYKKWKIVFLVVLTFNESCVSFKSYLTCSLLFFLVAPTTYLNAMEYVFVVAKLFAGNSSNGTWFHNSPSQNCWLIASNINATNKVYGFDRAV